MLLGVLDKMYLSLPSPPLPEPKTRGGIGMKASKKRPRALLDEEEDNDSIASEDQPLLKAPWRKAYKKPILLMDSVHRLIRLPPYVYSWIIDQSEMQLRAFVSQLSTASFVYRGATHSRLSHMIGTADYAMQVCRQLEIPEEDTRCIVLAAAAHDVGHGPFSHTFEHVVHLDHEERTKQIIRRWALRTPDFSPYAARVMALIDGETYDASRPYLGQIVANKQHGLDVDKLDYLERDSFYTGKPVGLNVARLIACMVVNPEGNLAFLPKARAEIEEVFRARRIMHETVYKHHTTHAMNEMMISGMRRLVDMGVELSGELVDGEVVGLLRRHRVPEWVALEQRQLWSAETLSEDVIDESASVAKPKKAPPRESATSRLCTVTLSDGWVGPVPLYDPETGYTEAFSRPPHMKLPLRQTRLLSLPKAPRGDMGDGAV